MIPDMPTQTDLLLVVVVAMFVLMAVTWYAGRVVGRIEAPMQSLIVEIRELRGALTQLASAVVTEMGQLEQRIHTLETRPPGV